MQVVVKAVGPPYCNKCFADEVVGQTAEERDRTENGVSKLAIADYSSFLNVLLNQVLASEVRHF